MPARAVVDTTCSLVSDMASAAATWLTTSLCSWLRSAEPASPRLEPSRLSRRSTSSRAPSIGGGGGDDGGVGGVTSSSASRVTHAPPTRSTLPSSSHARRPISACAPAGSVADVAGVSTIVRLVASVAPSVCTAEWKWMRFSLRLRPEAASLCTASRKSSRWRDAYSPKSATPRSPSLITTRVLALLAPTSCRLSAPTG